MAQIGREAGEHGVGESSSSTTNPGVVADEGVVEPIQEHGVPGETRRWYEKRAPVFTRLPNSDDGGFRVDLLVDVGIVWSYFLVFVRS